jgi:glycosyltransferase involved in cell wall biosynthesis
MGVKQHLDNVVEAARVAGDRGVPVRFVLLGDGNQRARLQEVARDVKSVQFIQPLPDKEFTEALCSADILLVNELPGVNEMAVPSKLTSYFASGLPVLAATARDSITADEIRASGGGVQIEAGDPEALVDAILRLSGDPQLREELGGSGMDFRARNLTAASAHDRYDEWLKSLAEN